MMKLIKGLALSALLSLSAVNAEAITTYLDCANSGNLSGCGPVTAFTPSLAGQTDQPVATYTTQLGYYYTVGNMTFVAFDIVTSGTTTKTTTGDSFAVTLPKPSVTQTGHFDALNCDVENATPIQYGSVGVIGSNTSQVLMQGWVGTQPALNLTQMTWATTSPGIGVLSHVLTAKCSGWYQTSAN